MHTYRTNKYLKHIIVIGPMLFLTALMVASVMLLFSIAGSWEGWNLTTATSLAMILTGNVFAFYLWYKEWGRTAYEVTVYDDGRIVFFSFLDRVTLDIDDVKQVRIRRTVKQAIVVYSQGRFFIPLNDRSADLIDLISKKDDLKSTG